MTIKLRVTVKDWLQKIKNEIRVTMKIRKEYCYLLLLFVTLATFPTLTLEGPTSEELWMICMMAREDY